jgi:homoserine dehydrogenase
VTRVALLGLGTVGTAVARRLTDCCPPNRTTGSDLSLTHIFDRRADAKRASLTSGGRHADGIAFTSRIDDVLQSDADVIVEAVGGVEPAGDWIRQALRAGKSVVTANKQLVARHGASLWRLAARQGRQFRFEAAVGGAMPIVRAVGEGLAGDRITRIVAVLNGTTNAVLSQMETTGCSLEQALACARANGLAEADPSADLDGDDAAAKLAILCALAFRVRIDPSAITAQSCAGVTSEVLAHARARGGTIRQIAHARFDYARAALSAWVAPIFVAGDTIFARAAGPQNAALITGEHCGDVGIFGAGAGGAATAVAIVSDIAAIARDRAAIVPAPFLTSSFCLLPSNFCLPSSLSCLEAL